MIRWRCPGCDRSYVVKSSLAGKTARCTNCGTAGELPTASARDDVHSRKSAADEAARKKRAARREREREEENAAEVLRKWARVAVVKIQLLVAFEFVFTLFLVNEVCHGMTAGHRQWIDLLPAWSTIGLLAFVGSVQLGAIVGVSRTRWGWGLNFIAWWVGVGCVALVLLSLPSAAVALGSLVICICFPVYLVPLLLMLAWKIWAFAALLNPAVQRELRRTTRRGSDHRPSADSERLEESGEERA